ncbi:MAG TPA: hypothetical protein VNY55_05680 [Mycobacterium sp.]|jgi:hypothetical protein|nr:hypothetical protein [Mycobacterium sp.]
MATDNAERQYLIAREMDLLLAEAERTENHLFDLDYENDNDPEVNTEKAWLDRVRARRDVLDEELQQLQRIQERADVVQLDDHRNH